MILWCDFETTGLSTEQHVSIEIGLALYETLASQYPVMQYVGLIRRMPQELEPPQAAPIAAEMHIKSGLAGEVLQKGLPLEQVQAEVFKLISQYVPADQIGKVVLAGNNIKFDRGFLEKDFPSVIPYLHYRTIDVSSFKEVVRSYGAENVPKLRPTEPCRI